MNNKKMTGIIIIIISCIGLIIGIVMVANNNLQTKARLVEVKESNNKTEEKRNGLDDENRVVERIEKQKSVTSIKENITKPKQNENTITGSKAKGDAFEKYIIHKFDLKYFKIKEWRSDKYTDGIYAESNHFPDFEIQFTLKGKSEIFAIECKWRASYFKNGIEWAEGYQLKNYKQFLKQRNIPVFVTIGVGGTPDKPEELFSIPLNEITNNFLDKPFLNKYRKIKIEDNFYYDSIEDLLK